MDAVYRPLITGKATGEITCPLYDPEQVRKEVFEYGLSDLARVVSQAGLPERKPPSSTHGKDALAVTVGFVE